MRPKIALILPLAGLLAGCASTYHFTVDAVQSPVAPATSRSFRLVDANPETTSGDLAYQEVADYVRTALSSKGMYEAPDGVTPDMTVEIDYGMDDLGKDVQTTAWDLSDPYEPKKKMITVYDKFLRVTAREREQTVTGPVEKEIWSVYVTNEDEQNDMRSYRMLLVSAAMDAIGRNSGGAREIKITANDPRVSFVQEGM